MTPLTVAEAWEIIADDLARRVARVQDDTPRAPDKLLLSYQEAADLLDLGYDELAKLVRSGEIRSVQQGRRVLVPRVALTEWIERRSRPYRRGA